MKAKTLGVEHYVAYPIKYFEIVYPYLFQMTVQEVQGILLH